MENRDAELMPSRQGHASLEEPPSEPILWQGRSHSRPAMENWSKERAHGAAGSTSGLGRSRPWPAMKKQAVVEREREGA